MKSVTLLTTLMLGLCASAHAALYNDGVIPDNTTVWSDTHTVSGLQPIITSVSVTLNLTGGHNGDLYAYLSYNGQLVVLLNRVGVGTGSDTAPTYSFGYSGQGFTGLVLQDGALNGNIHDYGGGTGSGTYAPDGRNVSPVVLSTADAAALYGTSQGTFNGAFGGMNPNGDWTLSFADMSGGDVSTLASWSLDITAVPEPINVALGVFAGLCLVGTVCRSERLQKLFAKPADSVEG